jgi:uncharacterized membrane protein YcfT
VRDLLLSRGSLVLPFFVVDAVQTVGGLVWALVLVSLASRLLDRPSAWVTWLVDSSLAVYMFHHPFVVLFASLLLATEVSAASGSP